MFRGQHHIAIHLPIPSHLPAERVLDAVQGLNSSLDHHPLVSKYEKRSVTESDLASLEADPFFGPGTIQNDLALYDVAEDVVIIPGVVTKAITFPTVYQRIKTGVKFRVHASAGVVVWGEMVVERCGTEGKADERRKVTRGSRSEYGDGNEEEGAEYEIVDRVSVEALSLLLPFVKRSMTKSHQKICQGLLDEVLGR
jgi:hypothetical protein